MENVLQVLQKLQEILPHKFLLKEEIDAFQRDFNQKKEVIARLKNNFIALNESVEQNKVKRMHLQQEITLLQEEQKNKEEEIINLSTQKEYEALSKELQFLSNNEQQVYKNFKHIESEHEVLLEQVANEQDLLEQQEQELIEINKYIAVQIAERNEQIAELQTREDMFAHDIDEELLFKFHRLVKKHEGNGIVSLKNSVCNNCHILLPAYLVNKVRQADELNFCPYCSVILYYEESNENNVLYEETLSLMSNEAIDDSWEDEGFDEDHFVDDFYDEDEDESEWSNDSVIDLNKEDNTDNVQEDVEFDEDTEEDIFLMDDEE